MSAVNTSKFFRMPPSGPPFRGSPGDAPIAQPDGTWKPGPAGAASIARFTSAIYVDSGTTFPLAEQTGSVSRPYAKIQDAIDANPGVPIGLQLVATSYAENVVVPAGAPVFFVPANFAQVSSLTLADGAAAFSAGALLALGALTLGVDATFIAFTGLTVAGSTVLADQADLQSFVAISLADVTLGDNTAGVPALLLKNSFSVGSIATSDPTDSGAIVMLSASDLYSPSGAGVSTSVISGPVTAPGYDLDATGILLAGDVVCTKLLLTGCRAEGNVSAGDVYLRDSSTDPGKAFVSTSIVQIIGSKVNAATWNNAAGQPFQLDAFSNYWIKVNGTALTNPGEKVITSDVVP